MSGPSGRSLNVDLKAFDAHCAAYPGAEMVVQWGNAHVWKVGGKVFAIASHWGEDGEDIPAFRPVFKASDLSFRMLTQQECLVVAPYLGRYKWVQMRDPGALSNEDLMAYVGASYDMVAAKLTKAQRRKLA
ncbi:MAG: MmcQ/YjbR family DNA-binding protein [Pseudomonadota bacterium]